MNKEYFVYILQSNKDGRRYIGFTEDLERRFSEHQKGLDKSTRHRRPMKLVHFESFSTKEDALEREEFYKTGKGREYLKDQGF